MVAGGAFAQNGKMSEGKGQMMGKMMGDMKAKDASLDQKVAAMNAATGAAKIEAMAAVINELVSQRKQMMAKMSSMEEQASKGTQKPDGKAEDDPHKDHH